MASAEDTHKANEYYQQNESVLGGEGFILDFK